MVDEIKNFIEEHQIIFGIKECLKKSDSVKKVFIVNDCREDVRKLLKANKIEFENLEFSKGDVSSRMGLPFQCEVFGLKK
ncbi:hypothetical protein COU60_03910 [Candidatus Pacearchaeota archaeon CG10_big_fil_rev_8_21_14_0_10_34_76]|nr:MAG: hypothetical protein COU60_03910 [Candidatus Pacearchaeota archaeon CG10_big_fil_rev_8_21_14_0_10_34_76]